jgi:hypothetical protein
MRFPAVLNYCYFLSPAPIQISAITVQVAMLVPQRSFFMPHTGVVPIVGVAPQFPAIMRNPHLIAPDVVSIPPIAIAGKHRSRAHADHQKNPSYHAFHGTSPSTRLSRNRIAASTAFKPTRTAQVAPRGLNTILYIDSVSTLLPWCGWLVT